MSIYWTVQWYYFSVLWNSCNFDCVFLFVVRWFSLKYVQKLWAMRIVCGNIMRVVMGATVCNSVARSRDRFSDAFLFSLFHTTIDGVLVFVRFFPLPNYWVNTKCACVCVCVVDIWVVSLTLHAISSHGISTELKICTVEKCVLIIYHLWTFYNAPFRANRYECALKINVAFSVYSVAKWGFDWTIICARYCCHWCHDVAVVADSFATRRSCTSPRSLWLSAARIYFFSVLSTASDSYWHQSSSLACRTTAWKNNVNARKDREHRPQLKMKTAEQKNKLSHSVQSVNILWWKIYNR